MRGNGVVVERDQADYVRVGKILERVTIMGNLQSYLQVSIPEQA